jgi:NDP-sugar pyrophosphorylase family protein
MSTLPPVCILAGGLGTRLGAAVADTPKPLVPVAGRPFLFHQLELLASYGADRVVLSTGYRGEQIEQAVGDGSAFGLHVAYSHDGLVPLGTGGAVRRAARLLDDRFLVLYGDTYLRIDYADVAREAEASGLPALMTVLRNAGQWDTSNVLYEDGRIVRYDKRNPTPQMQHIDYGLGVLTTQALAHTEGAHPDLAGLLTALSVDGLLAGYEAEHRFYEIGTPAALAETEQFLLGGAG